MTNNQIQTSFGAHQTKVDQGLETLSDNKIVARIWQKDHTVWKPEPQEITNRMGWMDIAERLKDEIPRMMALKEQLIDNGYAQVVLLGMGGSSLAPEVFAKTFGSEVRGLNLAVLDSTDPGAVLACANNLDLSKTLFIVATKSGGTVETLSFFKYFYNRVAAKVGKENAGEHFIAITDPGSKLEKLANEFSFRDTFLNDPNIGGRFSVMSFFGLVPATLVGLDTAELIQRATAMAQACQHPDENPGALLGTAMGVLNRVNRDKVTFVIYEQVASFGDWVEQLIAESTGKEGKGILPVVGEPLGKPEDYGDDRIFVHLRLDNDQKETSALNELAQAGHPVVTIQLNDKYDLGGQFFVWEFATAVASYFLEINPFDQPNVESAKVLARKMVAEYEATGKLPQADFSPTTQETLDNFLVNIPPGSYISLQAYITPTPEAEELLQKIRLQLRDKHKVATTLGFGPRFLHSTGQLHKGDAGHGYFVQISSAATSDVAIPDQPGVQTSAMSFQTLKMSQALGDGAALQEAGRKLLRMNIQQINALKTLGN